MLPFGIQYRYIFDRPETVRFWNTAHLATGLAAYRRTQRSSVQLGLRVGVLTWRWPTFNQRTQSELSYMASRRRWQHYKYRPVYYYYYYFHHHHHHHHHHHTLAKITRCKTELNPRIQKCYNLPWHSRTLVVSIQEVKWRHLHIVITHHHVAGILNMNKEQIWNSGNISSKDYL